MKDELKVKLLEPISTDAGTYGGMKDFQWGEVVEAVWMNDKRKGVYVKGSEFIRLGGCTEAFKHGKFKHAWGSFEIVE